MSMQSVAWRHPLDVRTGDVWLRDGREPWAYFVVRGTTARTAVLVPCDRLGRRKPRSMTLIVRKSTMSPWALVRSGRA